MNCNFLQPSFSGVDEHEIIVKLTHTKLTSQLVGGMERHSVLTHIAVCSPASAVVAVLSGSIMHLVE